MVEINFSEKELEDLLSSRASLSKYLGLRYVSRQARLGVGVIDILAYEECSNMYVIIELKKDYLDFDAYEQVVRYQRFLSAKYPNRLFASLIIGKGLSPSLNYLVKNYDPRIDCIDQSCVNYSLFGIKLNDPISFYWYSQQQMDIQKQHYEVK